MEVKKWLDKVAYIEKSDIKDDNARCYYSKFDDSYITRVGMEDNISALAKFEITEQLTHGVGFSPKDGKWYGWSHRAIYGFKIGSTCKKGDCHYVGKNIEEEIAHALDFWKCDDYQGMKAVVQPDGNIYVSWKYGNKTPNHTLMQRIGGCEWKVTLGRGEWVCKTMEDAKQMAIDFSNGVS